MEIGADCAELRAAAAAGDRSAMTELGARAERAGAETEAWRWWREAAFAGDEPAMRHLARALRRAEPDEAQLWRWHGVMAGKQLAAAGRRPAAVVAAGEGLGPLRLTFGHGDRSPAEAGLGCVLLLVLGVAAAGVVGLLSGRPALAAGAFAAAGLGLLLLVAGWLRVRGRRHLGVWEHEHGLVVRDRAGTVTAARWADLSLDAPVLHHPGGTLDLTPDAFPPGEQAVLVHRVAHHTARAGP